MSLAEEQLRHEMYIQRLASGMLNQTIYPSQEEALKAARFILNNFAPINTLEKLNKALAEIKREINAVYLPAWEAVTQEMQAAAVYEASYYANLVGTSAGVSLAIPADEKVIGFANRTPLVLEGNNRAQVGVWSSFVRANVDEFGSTYDSLVRLGYINGLTVNETVRSLNTATGGMLKNHAEALARTGIQHYASAAREYSMKENKDVISKRVYYAVMDNRTTTLCAGRHLEEYDIDDDNYPRIPAHFNCRSTYIYMVNGQEALEGDRPAIGGQEGEEAEETFERRANWPTRKGRYRYRGRRDSDVFDVEQVRANTKYDKWLRQQPSWFVESMLGKTRAKLFLQGGLSLSKFNDMVGRKLTLDELQVLDANAFERAGIG